MEHELVAVHSDNTALVPVCRICRVDANLEEIQSVTCRTLNTYCPENRIHPIFWVPLDEKNRKNNPKALARPDNKSGHKGIYRQTNRSGWMATIRLNGKRKYLGSFPEKQDAIDRYNEAVAELEAEGKG